MSGISLGIGGGLRAGGAAASPSVPASQVAPSSAAFGVGGVQATNPPSAAGTGPAHIAIYAGFVAGGLLALTWWSLPDGDRNEFGKYIFSFGTAFVFFSGIRTWGRVHVADGDVTGFMGTVYKAAALI